MSKQRDDIDPVTGYKTTGHDWNGITELNTPLPRIVIWALVLTFLYSVVTWFLLPAWPYGRDYTRGLWGLDQVERAEAARAPLVAERAEWLQAFAADGFATAAENPALRAVAWPAAARLFADNCALCHGREGQGGPGFPSLRDNDWLWGGQPDEIAQTLRAGINTDHPETHFAAMPAFGRDGILDSTQIAAVADHILALGAGQAEPDSIGAQVFMENCAACHGDDGSGGFLIGAPAFSHGTRIYGGEREAIMASIRNGREGVMPAWDGRLSAAEINLLAAWIADLEPEAAP